VSCLRTAKYAYFAMWPGIHKVRTSDGSLVEKVFAPFLTPYMFELAAQNRFFLCTGRRW
jgi:hypothetical protein